jgi:hypothetical protein
MESDFKNKKAIIDVVKNKTDYTFKIYKWREDKPRILNIKLDENLAD